MVFIDTAGWIALVHKRDTFHQKAVLLYNKLGNVMRVTSDAVLLETCNSLAGSQTRRLAAAFMEGIKTSERLKILDIVRTSGTVFEQGWNLFEAYEDKEWSLTDCISFVIMRERKMKESFTCDHHFEQAGFSILLK